MKQSEQEKQSQTSAWPTPTMLQNPTLLEEVSQFWLSPVHHIVHLHCLWVCLASAESWSRCSDDLDLTSNLLLQIKPQLIQQHEVPQLLF